MNPPAEAENETPESLGPVQAYLQRVIEAGRHALPKEHSYFARSYILASEISRLSDETILEYLYDKHRVVVTAPALSGKTVLLSMLAEFYAEDYLAHPNDGLIPIYARLIDAGSPEDVRDALVSSLVNSGFPVDREDFDQVWAEGAGLSILLDLDAQDRPAGARLAEAVHRFAALSSGEHYVLVTTRDLAMVRELRDFAHLILADLDLATVHEEIHSHVGRPGVEHLSRTMCEFARRPGALHILVDLQARGCIGSAEVVREFVRRAATGQTGPRPVDPVVHLSRGSSLPGDAGLDPLLIALAVQSFEQIFGQVRANPPTSPDERALFGGLGLSDAEPGPSSVALCALLAAFQVRDRWLSDVRFASAIRRYAHRSTAPEVLIEAAGLFPPGDARDAYLATLIGVSPDRFRRPLRSFLSAEVERHAVSVRVEYLRLLASGGHPLPERQKAVEELGRIGEAAWPALTNLLNEAPDAEIRPAVLKAAAEVIGTGPERVLRINEFLDHLRRSSDEQSREATYQIIGIETWRQVPEALLQTLEPELFIDPYVPDMFRAIGRSALALAVQRGLAEPRTRAQARRVILDVGVENVDILLEAYPDQAPSGDVISLIMEFGQPAFERLQSLQGQDAFARRAKDLLSHVASRLLERQPTPQIAHRLAMIGPEALAPTLERARDPAVRALLPTLLAELARTPTGLEAVIAQSSGPQAQIMQEAIVGAGAAAVCPLLAAYARGSLDRATTVGLYARMGAAPFAILLPADELWLTMVTSLPETTRQPGTGTTNRAVASAIHQDLVVSPEPPEVRPPAADLLLALAESGLEALDHLIAGLRLHRERAAALLVRVTRPEITARLVVALTRSAHAEVRLGAAEVLGTRASLGLDAPPTATAVPTAPGAHPARSSHSGRARSTPSHSKAAPVGSSAEPERDVGIGLTPILALIQAMGDADERVADAAQQSIRNFPPTEVEASLAAFLDRATATLQHATRVVRTAAALPAWEDSPRLARALITRLAVAGEADELVNAIRQLLVALCSPGPERVSPGSAEAVRVVVNGLGIGTRQHLLYEIMLAVGLPAVDPLLTAWNEPLTGATARQALWQLARSATVGVGPFVERMASPGPAADHSREIVVALGSAAVPALFTVYNGQGPAIPQSEIVALLSEMGAPAAEALLRLAATPDAPHDTWRQVRALFGHWLAANSRPAIAALAAALPTAETLGAALLMERLRSGLPDDIQAVIDTGRSTRDPAAAVAIWRLLGQLRPPQALPVLIQELNAEDEEVSRTALIAIRGYDPSLSIPALQAVADTAPQPIGVAALRALGAIHHPQAVRYLAGHLANPRPEVVQTVIEALRTLAAVRPLAPVLVRESVAQLDSWPETIEVDRVVDLLLDTGLGAQALAASLAALAQRPGSTGLQAGVRGLGLRQPLLLIDALDYGDEFARSIAARLLAELVLLDLPETLRAFRAAARHLETDAARRASVDVALRALAPDQVDEVRRLGLALLIHTPGPEATTSLASWVATEQARLGRRAWLQPLFWEARLALRKRQSGTKS